MCCQSTLHTRPILAKVARVWLLPSVRSHMYFQFTLLTRPILAKVARVRLLPRVRSQMFCQITLPTRPILAKVARVSYNLSCLASLRIISTAPLPLHVIHQFPTYSLRVHRRSVIRNLACSACLSPHRWWSVVWFVPLWIDSRSVANARARWGW